MYTQPAHAERDLLTLYKFIRENPLGVLTSAIKSSDHPYLQSTHIPWVLDPPVDSTTGTHSKPAKLRGHLARVNPQARVLCEAATSYLAPTETPRCTKLEEKVMIMFTSSIHHYVTPKFYVETKPSTGKVVPTWDYTAVQAYGSITVYHDSSCPESGEFLTKQINDLTRMCEEDIMGYDGKDEKVGPWTVDDAPERYMEFMKKAVIGVEVEITTISGKWKMSQERVDGDRKGVIDAFEGMGSELGKKIAKTVRDRGALKNASPRP